MESHLLNVMESNPKKALLPFEPGLLKAAEIFTASEGHLLNGAELFLTQEAMESFAFPDKIKSISTENPQKCSKLFFFSLELFEYSLYIWY